MGIVKMQRGNRNARQDKRLHDVSDYALTLREIHLEPAIVDYQALALDLGAGAHKLVPPGPGMCLGGAWKGDSGSR